MTNFKKCTVIIAVMIVFLSSCQKNDPVYVNTYSKDYSVNYKDWQIGKDDQSGMYYYVEIKEPNLTSFIYNNGTMQAFLYTNNGNISPLPFNDYFVDNDNYMYTEQITCEFVPGYVTFIIKSSDHQEILPHYDNYDFNVRFMW